MVPKRGAGEHLDNCRRHPDIFQYDIFRNAPVYPLTRLVVNRIEHMRTIFGVYVHVESGAADGFDNGFGRGVHLGEGGRVCSIIL